ncbi:spike base protein, RCAP_Rcc01079 family [Jiella avicenniae]|uniref:Uncharacterized protein n=1 Tax=Jiella avicenniae TaxID=2907202 RepID=A0A9X1P183_9HYPH|nr:hypothetical protein [Jiella avicenniae]MCE7028490.1 hypothetical protein [Jiella avicenniae]
MPIIDRYSAVGANGPGEICFPITPADGADLQYVTRAIYVGGAGDITIAQKYGLPNVTFVGVPAGTILPVRATRVLVTGTTATNLVGLT